MLTHHLPDYKEHCVCVNVFPSALQPLNKMLKNFVQKQNLLYQLHFPAVNHSVFIFVVESLVKQWIQSDLSDAETFFATEFIIIFLLATTNNVRIYLKRCLSQLVLRFNLAENSLWIQEEDNEGRLGWRRRAWWTRKEGKVTGGRKVSNSNFSVKKHLSWRIFYTFIQYLRLLAWHSSFQIY